MPATILYFYNNVHMIILITYLAHTIHSDIMLEEKAVFK